MKAVIVDVKSNYAIALNTKGQFIKIKSKKSYDIGCEVDISPNTGLFTGFYSGTGARIASLAAALLIIFGVGSYSFCYSLPYSYIDIDINPSIEITANMFDKIIKAEALNKDGAALVTAGNIKNMKIREGVNEILKNAVADGYIANDTENTILLFTISSKNEKKAAEIQKQLHKDTVSELGMAGKNTDVHINKTTINIHDNARKLGVSPGKLNIIDRLIKVKPELNAEDLIDKSVKDIMKEIKAARKDPEEDSDTDSTGSYGSNGNSDGNNNSDGNTNSDIYDDSVDSGDTAKLGGSDSSVDSGDSNGLINPGNSNKPNSAGNSGKIGKFSKPGNNGHSGKSSEQGDSGESGKPDKSGKPGKPDNSGKLGKPDNSGESSKSDNSGKTGKPDNSGKPGKPDNSGKPSKPDNPGKPSKPDNSGESGKSDNSGKTGKPDNSGKPGKSDNSGESGKSGNSLESGRPGDTRNSNKSGNLGKSGDVKKTENNGNAGNTNKPKDSGKSNRSIDSKVSNKLSDSEKSGGSIKFGNAGN